MSDLWDQLTDTDQLREAAREETRLRKEAEAEVERLRAEISPRGALRVETLKFVLAENKRLLTAGSR